MDVLKMNGFKMVFGTLLLCAQVAAHGQVVNVVVESRLIQINGSTNVSKFHCEFNDIIYRDTLSVVSRLNGKDQYFERLVIQIPVDGFDCGMQAMTSDFRDLLESDRHKHISMTIREFHYLEMDHHASAVVDITLAGNKRQEDTNVWFNYRNGILYLNGIDSILMTDYGLEPPQKFFGMIVVQNELEIRFQFGLKFLNGGQVGSSGK